jgi:phosphoribosyl 1,2-cyclic phosphodiesterase
VKKALITVRFWGVRGSIPAPGSHTVRYGGNTSCVEVDVEDELIIFDGGSGLRLLGKDLIRRNLKPIIASIFFSHTHWDHIQGFPFFWPAFMQGNVFRMFGALKVNPSLAQVLEGQMEFPNFPVLLKELPSKFEFHDLEEGKSLKIDLNPKKKTETLLVTWARLNHPGGVLAYRVQYRDKAVVYATDNEHVPGEVSKPLAGLARDADVLIYDSQYLPEEYETKRGWGHSTYEEGIKVCRAANVKKLVLFHHDPDRSDADVDRMLERARKIHPDSEAAHEGLVLKV